MIYQLLQNLAIGSIDALAETNSIMKPAKVVVVQYTMLNGLQRFEMQLEGWKLCQYLCASDSKLKSYFITS
jgi:hypothetical protein